MADRRKTWRQERVPAIYIYRARMLLEEPDRARQIAAERGLTLGEWLCLTRHEVLMHRPLPLIEGADLNGWGDRIRPREDGGIAEVIELADWRERIEQRRVRHG